MYMYMYMYCTVLYCTAETYYFPLPLSPSLTDQALMVVSECTFINGLVPLYLFSTLLGVKISQ